MIDLSSYTQSKDCSLLGVIHMFGALIAAIDSQVYEHYKALQIVYVKYLKCLMYQLYYNEVIK